MIRKEFDAEVNEEILLLRLKGCALLCSDRKQEILVYIANRVQTIRNDNPNSEGTFERLAVHRGLLGDFRVLAGIFGRRFKSF